MRNQSFNDFVAEWRTLIRPEGLEAALLEAYQLGPMARPDIARLPRFFVEYDRLWLREFGANLRRHPQIRHRIGEEDAPLMFGLLDAHRQSIRRNRFDAQYLDTIEALGLFFLYHEVMPLWVVGSYDRTKNRLLEAIEQRTLLYGDEEQRALIRGVTTLTLVDCTQFQRVYNVYDHVLAEESERRKLARTDYGATPVAGSSDAAPLRMAS